MNRRVAVNGIELHVVEEGDGPPLLLLHGWPQHSGCWRHMIGPLSERYRVIAPDLRGWGRSDAPPGDYAKSVFVADVLALLDAEGIDRADVIGHDWGGWTGFLLALEHPERVRRLVGVDIPPPWRGRLRARRLGAVALLSYQLPVALGFCRPALVRQVIKAASSRDWTDEELASYVDVLREPARARASSACYRTFLTRELPGIAAGRGHQPQELAVPTLLVMGGDSLLHKTLAPEPSRNLRVEVIPGAGHFLPEEAPSELLSLAGQHLAG